LLRNKLVEKTLPELGETLGTRYSTNGDFITALVPFRGFFVSWTGFIGLVVALVMHSTWGAIGAALAYYAGLWMSPLPYDPDIGTTNSDNIRFRGRDGKSQGAYIEGGRYPTPGGLLSALVVSLVTGHFRPRAYRSIHRIAHVLRIFVPPFGAFARSWPIPLLSMGKDDAFGTFRLDPKGRAVIDYDSRANRAFYAYLAELGRLVARAVDSYWLPDIPYMLTRRMEVPHNLGGVPMGESPADGVVDHAGRVYGASNLMVLDGSIIPVAVGPNPALTIAAIAERGVEIALAQLEKEGSIRAEVSS
jgi:cholesterol oxidase